MLCVYLDEYITHLSIFQAELMLFGLLSLLMGHWIVFVAKICVKSSVLSSRFFPCAMEKSFGIVKHIILSNSEYSNKTLLKDQVNNDLHNYCPEVVLLLIVSDSTLINSTLHF